MGDRDDKYYLEAISAGGPEGGIDDGDLAKLIEVLKKIDSGEGGIEIDADVSDEELDEAIARLLGEEGGDGTDSTGEEEDGDGAPWEHEVLDEDGEYGDGDDDKEDDGDGEKGLAVVSDKRAKRVGRRKRSAAEETQMNIASALHDLRF